MKKAIYIIFILALFIACINDGTYEVPPFHDIKLEATGTADRVTIEYEAFTGKKELFNTILPWELAFDTNVSDWPLFLSIQNLTSSGTITANIYIDGLLDKIETNADPFGFIAVYGTTP